MSDRGPSGRLRERAREAALELSELLSHEPGARLVDDSEDIHQMRVAVRRLRSILRAINARGAGCSATNSGGSVRHSEQCAMPTFFRRISVRAQIRSAAAMRPRQSHDSNPSTGSGMTPSGRSSPSSTPSDTEGSSRCSKTLQSIQRSTCRRKLCTGWLQDSFERPSRGATRRRPPAPQACTSNESASSAPDISPSWQSHSDPDARRS